MVYPGRTLIAGRQKTLITLAAVTLLMLPIVNTRLAEAILAFCFGGIVPGTDIIVPPDTVIWSVVGLLTSSAIVSAWFTARRSRRVRMHYNMLSAANMNNSKQAAIAVPVTVVEADTDTPIPYVQDAHTDRRKTHLINGVISGVGSRAVRAAMRRSAADTFAVISIVLSRIIGLISATAAVTCAVAVAGVRAGMAGIKNGFRSLAVVCASLVRLLALAARRTVLVANRVSLASLRFMARTAVGFWAWAEPHLWSFDAWLEIRVRKFESLASKKLSKYESLRTLRSFSGQYRAATFKSRTDSRPVLSKSDAPKQQSL